MSSLRSSFLRHIAQTSSEPIGFEVSRGEGIYLFDHDNKPYIDCISGIAVSSLGHNHPVILKAIRDQLDLHLHTMVYGEHIQTPQVQLAEKLILLLPPGLDCFYFSNSGTEAVEGSLKLARKFTSRYEIIACRNAYHGSTAGSESLRSDTLHTSSIRPLVPGIRHIHFNSFEDIKMISENTAAVIVESIQGEAGVILPSEGYLRSLKNRCQEVGALLILDEIQTGMGRTGSMWAFEQEKIIPDILLLAKAFGGGLPLGASISKKEIMDVLSNDPPLSHLTTFGGHPLSCAAALAAIRIIIEEDLHHKAILKGTNVREALSQHPIISQVRGRGLMMAVELKNPDQLHAVVGACKNEGLLVDWFLFNNKSVRIAPPLIISDDEVTMMCEKLTNAFDKVC